MIQFDLSPRLIEHLCPAIRNETLMKLLSLFLLLLLIATLFLDGNVTTDD